VKMGQKRTYKQYTKEYKEEAVALVREQGYSVPEADKSLGIAANMLYRWKQHIEDQQQGKVLAEDERVELNQLRKENKNLRMEKEILKKASAFFAKEMKSPDNRSKRQPPYRLQNSIQLQVLSQNNPQF
jgi:transposase